MPRPDARHHLLNAAERLFGEHGIPTVSDRQIAEAAGNSNHSAVRYYFGGRSGLLEALLERHQAQIETAQQRRFEQSDSLLGDVRALVLPVTDALAALEPPTWRARFLNHAIHDPSTAGLWRTSSERFPTSARIVASAAERLSHLDPRIVESRARLVTHIVSNGCAEIEARAQASGEPAPWTEAGRFLCDALTGLLQAPITDE